MQPIKNILRRPSTSPTRNMLNAFFLPEDQDGFARSQGYADAEQMIYYEDRERMEVPPMNDRDVQELVERGENADIIARAMGYESAQAITDELNRLEREAAERDAKGTVEYLAPPPSEILVLMRQDSREVYNEDDEACPLKLWYDTSAELAGVY